MLPHTIISSPFILRLRRRASTYSCCVAGGRGRFAKKERCITDRVHREDKQVGIKRQSPKLNIEKEKGGANGRFCYQNVISTSSPTRPVAAGPRIELPIPPALTPPGTAPPTPPSRPSMAGGYVTTSASARWSISDVKGSSGLRLRASWYESMAPSRSPSRCLARPRAEYPAWLPCFFLSS